MILSIIGMIVLVIVGCKLVLGGVLGVIWTNAMGGFSVETVVCAVIALVGIGCLVGAFALSPFEISVISH